MVLPYIDMNPPQVYMSSQSWNPLPTPSPYHLCGSSLCTSPKHPVSCIEHRLAIRFLHDSIHVSMPFSQIIPPSPSPTESKSLFHTSVSLLLSRIQGYHYHLSKFHIYVLVRCIGVFLSGLLHSPKKTYGCLTNTWKDAQHHSLSEKCKSRPQWGTISNQSEWLRSKSLQAINAGEGVEKREPSYTVGGNAN